MSMFVPLNVPTSAQSGVCGSPHGRGNATIGQRMSKKARNKRTVRPAPRQVEAWHRKVQEEEIATERLLRAVLRRSRQIDDVTEAMTGRRVWGSSRAMPDCNACAMSGTCDGAECALFDYALGAYRKVPNHYDQWELRYIAVHDGKNVPPSAYTAKTAAAYCASDPATCGITARCFNCHGCDEGKKHVV